MFDIYGLFGPPSTTRRVCWDKTNTVSLAPHQVVDSLVYNEEQVDTETRFEWRVTKVSTLTLIRALL